MTHPLELTSEALENALGQVTRFVREEIDSLADQPSADLAGADELARTFVESVPDGPRSLESILERLRPAIRKPPSGLRATISGSGRKNPTRGILGMRKAY